MILDQLGFDAFQFAVFVIAGQLILAAGQALRALTQRGVRALRSARDHRRPRTRAAGAGVPVPWREPGVGLAAALAEPGHLAARARLAALLDPITAADRQR